MVASFCRIPDFLGVALFPTRPCLVGVLDVVLRMDDIDPSADRFRGEEYTILKKFIQVEEVYCLNCVYASRETRSCGSRLSVNNIR